MPIDLNFVKTVSDNFRYLGENIHSCGINLCDTQNMGPSNANYGHLAYQAVYGARYLPAYYVEYYELADLLANRMANRARPLNIASFGCGLCQDYYALSHALNGLLNFNYWGYDAAAWTAIQFMPTPHANFSYLNTGVEYLRTLNIIGMDAIVFPKSLTDIYQSGYMTHLASVIGSTDRKELFFLNSYVRHPTYPSGDSSYFTPIHQSLLAQGFLQNYASPISEVHSGPICHKYPQFSTSVGSITCSKQTTLCTNCEAVKSPILYGNYSSYQLLEYVKP